jgi:glycosyltransferase involved in cell wall biosynthesis
MDDFTSILYSGMRERGHNVQIWRPVSGFSKLPAGKRIRKWLGYVDQFLVFPALVRLRIIKCKKDTLFVFTDQALGPWIPMVCDKRHVVHCHDFLALQSAAGLVEENITSLTGRFYQDLIKKGFCQGKNFIAVSRNTSKQLTQFHTECLIRNEVVYNGLKKTFVPLDPKVARTYIQAKTGIIAPQGYILHVGGNQWYKNRRGVVEIYDAWRGLTNLDSPLLLVGESPSEELYQLVCRSRFRKDIHFITGKNDDFIQHAYCGAHILLFPSLAEGFGWPIGEAMACGCAVLTTNLAPMTEVGGEAAYYIDRRPSKGLEVRFWAEQAANVMENAICAPENIVKSRMQVGLENSRRFNLDAAMNQIERIYLEVV